MWLSDGEALNVRFSDISILSQATLYLCKVTTQFRQHFSTDSSKRTSSKRPYRVQVHQATYMLSKQSHEEIQVASKTRLTPIEQHCATLSAQLSLNASKEDVSAALLSISYFGCDNGTGCYSPAVQVSSETDSGSREQQLGVGYRIEESHMPSALRTAGVANTQVARRIDAVIAICILGENYGFFVRRMAEMILCDTPCI